MDAVRVFVTNAAGHDYSAAEKYGELVWVTKGYVSFQSLDRVKYQVCEQLKSSNSEDWLLLSGTLLISVIAATCWLHMHGQVKLLVIDRASRSKYRELVLTQKNFNDILELVNDTRNS